METKLSMSVMQNLLARCWFYIIVMCGTDIKTFFILSIICYIIHLFSFSFIFFLIERSILTIETKWLADLLQTIFLGG